jgi:hypothetical protein
VVKLLFENQHLWLRTAREDDEEEDYGDLFDSDEDDDEENYWRNHRRRRLQRHLDFNLKLTNFHGQRPMLIVCYTNHALDQFLEGILTFLPNGIVRVGSQSKNEALQK